MKLVVPRKKNLTLSSGAAVVFMSYAWKYAYNLWFSSNFLPMAGIITFLTFISYPFVLSAALLNGHSVVSLAVV